MECLKSDASQLLTVLMEKCFGIMEWILFIIAQVMENQSWNGGKIRCSIIISFKFHVNNWTCRMEREKLAFKIDSSVKNFEWIGCCSCIFIRSISHLASKF